MSQKWQQDQRGVGPQEQWVWQSLHPTALGSARGVAVGAEQRRALGRPQQHVQPAEAATALLGGSCRTCPAGWGCPAVEAQQGKSIGGVGPPAAGTAPARQPGHIKHPERCLQLSQQDCAPLPSETGLIPLD